MSASPQERAHRRDAFRRMNARQKLDYIAAYYRLPILLSVIALVILCSAVHRQLTKKEAVLYTALVNISAGETLEHALTAQCIAETGGDVRTQEVSLYRGLYLSDDASPADHEYAYASRLKLLGAINAKKLDVVLMNREAYDVLSRSGYLLELPELLSRNTRLLETLGPYLVENEVILEDNFIAYQLNEASSYETVTEQETNALEASALPALRSAGFPDAVYLGVIANSARTEWVLRYLDYLLRPL